MRRDRSGAAARPLRLAVTLGDANGIGPEIVVRGLAAARGGGVRWIAVGSCALAARAARAFETPTLPEWAPGLGNPRARVSLWDPGGAPSPRVRPGRVAADAGRASARWVEAAADACRSGALDGVVTAPICKESWARAGVPYPGHTELLAARAGRRRFAMLLMGGGLRVVLATRHLPLREVPDRLDRRKLAATIRLAWESLDWLGCAGGAVAVCGLNPHAGDGGLLGDEERRIIAPAIAAARRAGARVVGPVPGDIAFHQAAAGAYAAVVAMYHDQGLAPLKLAAFETGVNLTLGLPWVRTSPDHGTAFDRAWRGDADPRSLQAALDWAVRLARRKNPWR